MTAIVEQIARVIQDARDGDGNLILGFVLDDYDAELLACAIVAGVPEINRQRQIELRRKEDGNSNTSRSR